MHEVSVLCFCDDIEHCRFERYIADVRIAESEISVLEQAMGAVLKTAVLRRDWRKVSDAAD